MAQLKFNPAVVDAVSSDVAKQPGTPQFQTPAQQGNSWDLFQEKRQREAQTSAGDYFGAMWRQDGVTDGIVRHMAQASATPDATYSPFGDSEWARLTKDIPREYHSAFYNATSSEQASGIRDQLLQKFGDEQNLGDMGVLGNAGRVLWGLANPESLLLGIASGGATELMKFGQTAYRAQHAVRVAKDITEATAAATNLSAVAGREASKAAMVGGALTGGALGATFEKARQSVNFENDHASVLDAALMGTLLSAPFVYLHGHQMGVVSRAADIERRVLHVVAKDAAGEALTPEDLSVVGELKKRTAHMAAFEQNDPKAVSEKAAEYEAARKQVDSLKSQQEEDLWQAHEAPAIDPENPPEGFLPGSVGSAQVGKVPADEGHLSPDFDQPTAASKARFDIFAQMNRSKNPVVKELAHLLVKDAIGNSKQWAQRWSATERKKHYQRVIGGKFHSEARDAFDEVRKIRGWGPLKASQNHEEFYRNVSRVTRGDKEVLDNNPDIAPQLQRASAAQAEAYSRMAAAARKSGLEGAENLPTERNYVNRVWNHNNIRKAMDEFGETTVIRALAAAMPAFRNSEPKAASFLSAVKKLEFNHALQDIHLMAKDMGALRKELGALKDSQDVPMLGKGEIDALVESMFEAKKTEEDAGLPGNLRYRMDIDENYSHPVEDGRSFRVDSLWENDSRLLVDKYLNSMAGHTALAEKGFASRAQFMARINDAQNYHVENEQHTTDAAQINRELQLAKDMYDHVTGRPMSMQSHNRFDRFAGSFRAYTRSLLLGQLGVYAAGEMKNAVALATWHAAWQQMPSLREFVSMCRSGYIPNKELSQDIMAMSGFGREGAMSFARQHEISEFTYDKGLTQFDNFSNKASHLVDVVSGNNRLTSMTRQWAAAMMIQKHLNMAEGKLKLTPSLHERLVHNGIDDSMIEPLFSDLKKYTDKSPSGTVEGIHWEDWQQQSPKTYDAYTLLIEREVRDAIQDHDIGETGAFMHTPIGKIFGELRTFNMAAHAKQFLKGAHYHDRMTGMIWSTSLIGEGLGYIAQTAINYSQNPQELDKRLTLERISQAAVARSGALGIVPSLLDTAYFVGSGGDQILQPGATANTNNRNLLLPPSWTVIEKMYGSAGTLGKVLNPLSPHVVTKNDMRNLMSLIPGGNAWGMRNLNDYVSSQFPKSDPASRPHHP